MSGDDELIQRFADLLEQQRRPSVFLWTSILFAVAGAGMGGTGLYSTQGYYTRADGERFETDARRQRETFGVTIRREIDAAARATESHVSNHPDVALDRRLREVEQAIARLEAKQ